jgi:hypothetical protein
VCLVTGNHSIRRVNASTGAVSTLVGARSTLGLALAGYADATSAADARLRRPEGVAFDPAGLRLVVADTGNHALRVIAVRDGVTGAVTTVAGDGLQGIGLGDASKARLSAPGAASFSPDGSPPPPPSPPKAGGPRLRRTARITRAARAGRVCWSPTLGTTGSCAPLAPCWLSASLHILLQLPR